jgi:hypothetical protein
MPGTRVNDKSRRLVNDDQVVIFEENIKRDRLWPGLDFFQWRLSEINLVSTSDDLAWPAGQFVESNKPVADQLLKSGTGEFWKALCQKLIEANLCFVRWHDKLDPSRIFGWNLSHRQVNACREFLIRHGEQLNGQ